MVREADNLDIMPTWLVSTKLAPSRANVELVHRPRLIETLNQSLNRKLAIITAPAGFGKSTLLHQWFDVLTGQDMVCGWLTLDENDVDAHMFLSYVTLSLAQAGIDIGELLVSAQNGFSESSIRKTTSSILSKIREHERKCLLLLDDYQTVLGSEIDELLNQLIEEMPPNLTIVVNSRVEPNLNLPRLMANGELIQIPASAMRLSKEETLSTLGVELGGDEIEAIFEKTEGWPVAVQLARFHNNSQMIKNSPIGDGTSNLIASYLTDQVISNVDEDTRDFLLHVASLDSFNPDLANFVRKKDDSWEILTRMGSLSAFLISLPQDGNWFRLHHLISQYLTDTLRLHDNQKIGVVHQRASEWHEDRGAILEAIKYAVRMKDFARCEALFLKAGGWKIILREGISVIRSIFRLIPDQVVSASGRLLIARAYLHCKDGEYIKARGMLEASKSMRSVGDGEAYDRDFAVISSLVSIYEEKLGWLESAAQMDVEELVAGTDDLENGTLIIGCILSYLAVQDYKLTESGLNTAFRFFRRSDSILGVNYCYIHAAILAAYQADFDLAQANIQRAIELSESNFGSDSGLKHLSTVIDFSIKIWLGKFNPEDKPDFLTSLLHVTKYDGWSEIYMFALDAAHAYACASGDRQFEDEVFQLISNLSKRRQLIRVDSFISAMQIPKTYNMIQRPSQIILDWEKRYDYKAHPVYWQAYYMVLIELSSQFSPKDPLYIKRLDQALEQAKSCGSDFHHLRLSIAKGHYLHRSKDIEGARVVILDSLKTGVRKRSVMPFIGCEKTAKLLREIGNDMRLQNEGLILSNFISDALTYFDAINPKSKNSILSNRENDIMLQLALGKSNKEIARVFELTENTVKFHLKSIYKKLKVNNRTQSIGVAKAMGLIE